MKKLVKFIKNNAYKLSLIIFFDICCGLPALSKHFIDLFNLLEAQEIQCQDQDNIINSTVETSKYLFSPATIVGVCVIGTFVGVFYGATIINGVIGVGVYIAGTFGYGGYVPALPSISFDNNNPSINSPSINNPSNFNPSSSASDLNNNNNPSSSNSSSSNPASDLNNNNNPSSSNSSSSNPSSSNFSNSNSASDLNNNSSSSSSSNTRKLGLGVSAFDSINRNIYPLTLRHFYNSGFDHSQFYSILTCLNIPGDLSPEESYKLISFIRDVHNADRTNGSLRLYDIVAVYFRSSLDSSSKIINIHSLIKDLVKK